MKKEGADWDKEERLAAHQTGNMSMPSRSPVPAEPSLSQVLQGASGSPIPGLAWARLGSGT